MREMSEMTGLPLRGGGLGRKTETCCHSQPPRAGTTACHPSPSCPTTFAHKRGVQAHRGTILSSWHTHSLKFPSFLWTYTNTALNMYLCKAAHPNWAAVERGMSCFRQCLHMKEAWNTPCARDPTPSPCTGRLATRQYLRQTWGLQAPPAAGYPDV